MHVIHQFINSLMKLLTIKWTVQVYIIMFTWCAIHQLTHASWSLILTVMILKVVRIHSLRTHKSANDRWPSTRDSLLSPCCIYSWDQCYSWETRQTLNPAEQEEHTQHSTHTQCYRCLVNRFVTLTNGTAYCSKKHALFMSTDGQNGVDTTAACHDTMHRQ